jgi:ABC-2 type transport system ATP-binding protein
MALALCGNPELLFLDEPTAGLDTEARRLVWTSVRNFVSRGRSVLLTTHYLEEAESLANRVVLLQGGAIVARGTPSEIKARTRSNRLEDAYVELMKGEVI